MISYHIILHYYLLSIIIIIIVIIVMLLYTLTPRRLEPLTETYALYLTGHSRSEDGARFAALIHLPTSTIYIYIYIIYIHIFMCI